MRINSKSMKINITMVIYLTYLLDCSAKLFINYKLGKNSASLFIMNKE